MMTANKSTVLEYCDNKYGFFVEINGFFVIKQKV